MSFRLGFLAAIAGLAAVFSAPQAAEANYFVWTDPETEMTVSFPDTWMRLNNQKPGDKISVAGPSEADLARCVVHVREDKRFLYFPHRYRDAVQKVAYSTDFWSEIFANYGNVQVHRYLDGAGLGKGAGSYVLITYDEKWPKDDTDMAGVMLVSLYHDDAYIASCSSKKQAFDYWRGTFGSILSSVQFKKVNSDLFVGEYRDFINDINLVFTRQDGLESMKY